MAITAEDVLFAAEKIQAEGGNPTIEKIRLVLGAGSNTTISKYLKDWRDSRHAAKPAVSSPPDQVQAAVSAVWEKLQQETLATIETVKAEAMEQVSLAQQAAIEANSALAALQSEREVLQTQFNALSAQKELLILDCKQAETQQQLLRERIEGLQSRQQEITYLHEQQLKILEEKYSAEIVRLQSHTQQEVQLARQLADALKSHYEEARVDSMRQLDQLKVENQKQNETLKRLEIENASLKQSLEAKMLQQQELGSQLTDANKQIQILQLQWDALQDKRFVTEEIVHAFHALPGQVANELQARLSEQIQQVVDQAVKLMHQKLKEVAYA